MTISCALAECDVTFDQTLMNDRKLDKGIHKVIFRVNDRLYPPKHIPSVTAGMPTTDFSGGGQMNKTSS